MRLLALQFCSHLLAAGVIRRVEAVDDETAQKFKVNNYCVFKHIFTSNPFGNSLAVVAAIIVIVYDIV